MSRQFLEVRVTVGGLHEVIRLPSLQLYRCFYEVLLLEDSLINEGCGMFEIAITSIYRLTMPSSRFGVMEMEIYFNRIF